MTPLMGAVVAATTVKAIGVVIAVITGIAVVAYLLVNIRQGRPEVGAEIELAPNRKPYYDDEQLEGKRLNRALASGLVLVALTAVGLPLYWLNEPGRQSGAVENFDQTFVNRGAKLFAPTEEGGYNCAGCHGAEGVGGQAPPYTLTDANKKFVATVTWKAPALNTVLLRFSKEELLEILTYGRPGTPMPAWGTAGGGPLTLQQLDELVAYISSIQLTSDEAKAEVEGEVRKELGLDEKADIDWNDPATGKVLFNLGLQNGFAGGAYSCSRCHTKGASFRYGPYEPADADLSDYTGYPDGTGAFGFALTSGVIPRQFLSIQDLIDFLTEGTEYGLLYGQRGQGSGRMPGFGDNFDDDDDPHDDDKGDGMFTEDMICSVAKYEASLGEEAEPITEGCDRIIKEMTQPSTTTTAATGGGGSASGGKK
ncbi:MAG: c-type cytochrome [Acidimicrobiales bacterium]